MLNPLSRATAVLVLIVVPAISLAQTRPKTSTAKSANVKAGTFVSVDTSGATITLKPRLGSNVVYRYTEKTQMLRDKKPAEIDAFKTGDEVVVRFKKSKIGPAALYDLADKKSWEWLVRLRTQTVIVTLKELSEESLQGTEGADSTAVTYKVSDKTLFSHAGKTASASDFKAGDKVYVVPRSLPSGNIMAVAVADSLATAERLKERAKTTVGGTVRAIDLTKHILNLHTIAGDERELLLDPECTVRQASKDVPLSAVHTGLQINAHVTHNDEGELVVNKITILSKRTTTKKPTTIKPASKGLVAPKTGTPPSTP